MPMTLRLANGRTVTANVADFVAALMMMLSDTQREQLMILVESKVVGNAIGGGALTPPSFAAPTETHQLEDGTYITLFGGSKLL